MDRRRGSNGVRGGASSQDDLQGTKEKLDHSDDSAGLEQHDARREGVADGSSGIKITSMEELSDAIKLRNLSQVTLIDLNMQDIGSGLITVAKALASGQMSALEVLSLLDTGLEGDRCEAIGNALTLMKFPSLRLVNFGHNAIGNKGIEALACAIRSGNLEKLDAIYLFQTGINDRGMVALATSFQHGETNVLPNLRKLDLSGGIFTEVGLKSLAEALKSGRLNLLESLDVRDSRAPSQENANALVSALALNNSLVVEIKFEWHTFPELKREVEQLRERNIRHKEILAVLSRCSTVPAAFGKIYLCGDPKMGKTTLCHTLKRTFWQSLLTWERSPHVETRTRGIDVSEISSKGSTRKNQNPITLLVWDMAGQQDYHLVHNAFFPTLSFSEGTEAAISQGNATTFVIVCNSSNVDDFEHQLDYWLRYIASSSHKNTKPLRQVFVVQNNMGGDKMVQENYRALETLLERKRDMFTEFLDVHTDPFVVDVRRRGKVNVFKGRLLDHSRTLLKDQKVPEICDVIQRSLPSWSEPRKDFPVLGWEEFLEKVKQVSEGRGEEWLPEIILSATKYLNEAGVLIYVDKSFPPQWGIPSPRLVILTPNWLCNEILGNIFLSRDMVNRREGDHIFRRKLDPITGSISMSDFNSFFKSRWSVKDCDDLIAILLWLGLCYKGMEAKLYIPSLIHRNVERGDPWQSQSAHQDEEEQWVMGFSIEHQKNEMTLAPMSLWHRFQVQLAQTPRFTGADVPDNDFVAGKYFMTFIQDYMNVRIEVNAGKDSPTFDEINFFVKPQSRRDELDIIQRKQCQVNLADELVDILLRLWNEICGGVQYVHKVVWPWPVSQPRPMDNKNRNVEVAQVKKWVQMHCMGRKMQWLVGSDSAITEDQLLSTKDKKCVIMSAENEINFLRQGMQEAVSLGIYPPELTKESEVSSDGNEMEEAALGWDGIQRATRTTSPTAKKLHKLSNVNRQLQKMDKKLDKMIYNQSKILEKVETVERILREGFAEVLKEQKRVFRKLQETQRFFKEDEDRTCPNLIYLGERDSGVWATLKQALSSTVKYRLRFACEAMYNNYRPHQVQDQQGIDVSHLKPSLEKIVP